MLTISIWTTSNIFLSTPTYAASYVDGTCYNGFLGLTSWNCNVNISDQDSLKAGIWTIASNIFTDITIIAAYLIVGYVIYGGYLYIFSSGDPSKVATGKKALYQSFIGLAIVMLAHIILNSIRVALLGSGGSFAQNCAESSCITPSTLVTNAIQWSIGIAGVVAAIFVVYGGISYTTSSGDANKLQKAKTMIIYALIGLVIVALAEIITAFVSNMIRESETSTTLNTIISKEIYAEKMY